MNNKTYYTVTGTVRGNCGHQHRTLQGAERCLNSDRKGCSSHGGYSDRHVYSVDSSGTKTRYVTYYDHGNVQLGESEPDMGAFA